MTTTSPLHCEECNSTAFDPTDEAPKNASMRCKAYPDKFVKPMRNPLAHKKVIKQLKPVCWNAEWIPCWYLGVTAQAKTEVEKGGKWDIIHFNVAHYPDDTPLQILINDYWHDSGGHQNGLTGQSSKAQNSKAGSKQQHRKEQQEGQQTSRQEKSKHSKTPEGEQRSKTKEQRAKKQRESRKNSRPAADSKTDTVQGLLSPFRISGTNFYELAAFGHLQSKGILPGSRSDAMDAPYNWPLEWNPRTPPGDACFAPLQHSHPDSWQLLISLGGHFLKRLIAALLAPNGHFPSLLLFTLWGIQGDFTSLCVQGIFGSGKTHCASLLLVLVSTVLRRLPTVLTSEPILPLATAAETISDLLRDAGLQCSSLLLTFSP